MESDDGFAAFSRAIASDPVGVLLAKWRRDVITRKLMRLPDVVAVIPSGSLARGTQIGPVHDVDLIAVIDKSKHPDYGISGKSEKAAKSAEGAIADLEKGLLEQLHPWLEIGLLKETEQRTHVVTLSGDWAGPFKDFIPGAPPVDVLPAVRAGSRLLIPERGTGWIETDPEDLIRQVAQRQREWNYFTTVSGMVKEWARLNNLKIKNLAIDVMVLKYCPRPGLFETLSCGDAVARFFKAAYDDNFTSLKDPTGRCRKLDLGINFGRLHTALGKASDLARLAMDAENMWKHHPGAVIHPNAFWHQLFGRKYPRAKERFWRPAEAEPWVAWRTAEPRAADGPDDWAGPDNPRPDNPRPDDPGGGPRDPDRDPDDLRPGPGAGAPPPSGRPPGPRGPRSSPGSAEPGASPWPGIFGPAAPTVPLTYG